jgi:hypothetical protein
MASGEGQPSLPLGFQWMGLTYAGQENIFSNIP